MKEQLAIAKENKHWRLEERGEFGVRRQQNRACLLNILSVCKESYLERLD